MPSLWLRCTWIGWKIYALIWSGTPLYYHTYNMLNARTLKRFCDSIPNDLQFSATVSAYRLVAHWRTLILKNDANNFQAIFKQELYYIDIPNNILHSNFHSAVTSRNIGCKILTTLQPCRPHVNMILRYWCRYVWVLSKLLCYACMVF